MDGLRRKDTTRGPPLRILSLDGGGIRGYSMLVILERLMHKTYVEIHGEAPKSNEIPRPCDHFDLIAGTGTGGLIALMLGRLRLDIDTCKKLYVSLTKRVFETDKRIAGIPYGSTLFKASKLEEAIRECVRAHTVSEYEGNDTLANATPMTPDIPVSSPASSTAPHRSLSQSSRYSQNSNMSGISQRMSSYGSLAFGNANALLYDQRENRTKTAVTAVYRGTDTTTLLRSYDSRKEPAPDVKCTIWQAGRATSATDKAFKPIQIGQSWYLDEGAGKYNPSPLILDEAVQNEWPGREVGVFVSIGTGKRPSGTNNRSSEWWEGFLGGSMGEWAEARRKLIQKLEDCENTHQDMLRERLMSRGVNVENYYRLNVEVGVGEFGMNEWSRMSEIDTNTRTYLAQRDVDAKNQSAAAKMAKVHFAKIRHDRSQSESTDPRGGGRYSWQDPQDRLLPLAQPSNPLAVELPGDDMWMQTQGWRPGAQSYEQRPSISGEKFAVVSGEYHQQQQHPPNQQNPISSDSVDPRTPPLRPSHPSTNNNNNGGNNYPPYTTNPYPSANPRTSLSSVHGSQHSPPAPPLPPKTPINGLPYPDQSPPPPPSATSTTASVTSPQSPTYAQSPSYAGQGYGPRTFTHMGDLGRALPYPDVDGPPPAVNRGSKPTVSR